MKSWVEDYLPGDSGESFLDLLGASKCVMGMLDPAIVRRALRELMGESPKLARAALPHDVELTWQKEYFQGYLVGVLSALRTVDEELARLKLPVLRDKDRQQTDNLITKIRAHRKKFLRQFMETSTSDDLYTMQTLYGRIVARYIVKLCKRLLIHTMGS